MTHKLILQAPDIATGDLKQLARLSHARAIEAVQVAGLGHQAFRLVDADPASHEAVAAHCAAQAIDYAFMPADTQLADVGLVVMDMDSTLINIECIDEIADGLGLKPQVAAITERSMRGEIDFRQSLTERVALLAGLEEAVLERVYTEKLRLNPGAELMLRTLHAAGAQSLLISGGFTFFTERLRQRLGLSRAVANVLETSAGKLTGRLVGPMVDAETKAVELESTRRHLGLGPGRVVALGDGANDLRMLAAADYGIAYHAKPVVQAQAAYAFNHIGLDGVLALFA
ncbi:phosphoserine phosphatase SerB [Chitinimonas lacunae]|uniref:Phosphoserine phosphatase n=1 Tax=Chitinimonas lacunae TaxID=1963018 RepID=A0ABV8MM79_9NEIS